MLYLFISSNKKWNELSLDEGSFQPPGFTWLQFSPLKCAEYRMNLSLKLLKLRASPSGLTEVWLSRRSDGGLRKKAQVNFKCLGSKQI